MFRKYFFNRNPRAGSKTTAPQPDEASHRSEPFGVVVQQLQQELQQNIAQPNRLQIRCAVREGTLLVLIEHLLHVEPDPAQTFTLLEQTIRELVPEFMQSAPHCNPAGRFPPLPVRIYLRVAGYQQPYAFHSFALEPVSSPQTQALQNISSSEEKIIIAPTEAEPINAVPEEPAVFQTPVEGAESFALSEGDEQAADTQTVEVDIVAVETFELGEVEQSEEFEQTADGLETAERPWVEEGVEVIEEAIEEETPPITVSSDLFLAETIVKPESSLVNLDPESLESGIPDTEFISDAQMLETIERNAQVSEATDSIAFEPAFEALEQSIPSEETPQTTPADSDINININTNHDVDVDTDINTDTDTDITANINADINEINTVTNADSSVVHLDSFELSFVSADLTDGRFTADLVENERVAESTLEPENLEPEQVADLPCSEEVSPEVTEISSDSSDSIEPIAENLNPFIDSGCQSLEPVESLEAEPESVEEDLELFSEGSRTIFLNESITAASAATQDKAEPGCSEEFIENTIVGETVTRLDERVRSSLSEWPDPAEALSEYPGSINTEFTAAAENAAAPEIAEIADSFVERAEAPLTNVDFVENTTELATEESSTEATEAGLFVESNSREPEPIDNSFELGLVENLSESTTNTIETQTVQNEPEHATDTLDTSEYTNNYSIAYETTLEPTTWTEQIANLDEESDPSPTDIEAEQLISDPSKSSSESSESKIENNSSAGTETTTASHSLSEWGTDDSQSDLKSTTLNTNPITQSFTSGPSTTEPVEASNSSPVINQIKNEEPSGAEGNSRPFLLIPNAHDKAASSLDRLPLELDKSQRLLRFRPSLATVMLTSAVGLFVAVSSAYVLSRPCTFGSLCDPLQEAQQLSQKALDTVQSNPSALEVVDAYDQLTQANQILQTIPPWSRHRQAAQARIAEYTDKVEVLGLVVKALNQANNATKKSLNPPHPIQVWREVQWIWRDAIALLEKVPEDSAVYALAQKKLTEYETNLDKINHRVMVEQEAQDRIAAVRQAAEVTEARSRIINSVESWQQTYTSWQTLIAQLEQIPQGTMAYAEAQRLMPGYQLRLEAAERRQTQQELSVSEYNKALNLAEQARQLEQQSQWSQAAEFWREAISSLRRVPEDTLHYSQAQALLEPYTASLNQVQTNLQQLTLIQTTKPQLENLCAGVPKRCTYTVATEGIRVQLTPQYDQVVEQVLLAAQIRGNTNVRSDVANQVNQLLRSLASISETAQVPVELYDSSGARFGTYDPNRSGYITQ